MRAAPAAHASRAASDEGRRTQGARGHRAPRRVRRTRDRLLLSCHCLTMSRRALADAFWHHFGVRSARQIRDGLGATKVFVRFIAECGVARRASSDVHHGLLVRYVEWLNAQRRTERRRPGPRRRGRAPTRRCGCSCCGSRVAVPGLLGELHFPFNPFPWRNRDSGHVQRLRAQDLRAILKACERDITALRALRLARGARGCCGRNRLRPTRLASGDSSNAIDQHYQGIIPIACAPESPRSSSASAARLQRTGATSRSSRTCTPAPSRCCPTTSRS